MPIVRRTDKDPEEITEELETMVRTSINLIEEMLTSFYRIEHLYEVRDYVENLIVRWEADLPYDGEPGEEN